MKLDEIQTLLDDNEKITDDVSKESKKIPILHGKLLGVRASENLLLRSLNLELQRTYATRWLFYSGKAHPEEYKKENFDLKVLRGDISTFLEADQQLQTIRSKIAVQEAKMELLNEAIKGVMQRTFLLKTMLDYQKLISGVM